MTTRTFEYPCLLETEEQEEREYILTISCCFTNDGIGPYEYWGAKCFDKGQDYVEDITLESATCDGNRVTDEATLAEIENWMDENKEKLESAAFEPEDY